MSQFVHFDRLNLTINFSPRSARSVRVICQSAWTGTIKGEWRFLTRWLWTSKLEALDASFPSINSLENLKLISILIPHSEPIEKLNKTVQTKAISAYSSTLLFNSLSLIHSGNYTCTGRLLDSNFLNVFNFFNFKVLNFPTSLKTIRPLVSTWKFQSDFLNLTQFFSANSSKWCRWSEPLGHNAGER